MYLMDFPLRLTAAGHDGMELWDHERGHTLQKELLGRV